MYVGDAEAEGNGRSELLHTTCGTPNYVAPEVGVCICVCVCACMNVCVCVCVCVCICVCVCANATKLGAGRCYVYCIAL